MLSSGWQILIVPNSHLHLQASIVSLPLKLSALTAVCMTAVLASRNGPRLPKAMCGALFRPGRPCPAPLLAVCAPDYHIEQSGSVLEGRTNAVTLVLTRTVGGPGMDIPMCCVVLQPLLV